MSKRRTQAAHTVYAYCAPRETPPLETLNSDTRDVASCEAVLHDELVRAGMIVSIVSKSSVDGVNVDYLIMFSQSFLRCRYP